MSLGLLFRIPETTGKDPYTGRDSYSYWKNTIYTVETFFEKKGYIEKKITEGRVRKARVMTNRVDNRERGPVMSVINTEIHENRFRYGRDSYEGQFSMFSSGDTPRKSLVHRSNFGFLC